MGRWQALFGGSRRKLGRREPLVMISFASAKQAESRMAGQMHGIPIFNAKDPLQCYLRGLRHDATERNGYLYRVPLPVQDPPFFLVGDRMLPVRPCDYQQRPRSVTK